MLFISFSSFFFRGFFPDLFLFEIITEKEKKKLILLKLIHQESIHLVLEYQSFKSYNTWFHITDTDAFLFLDQFREK
jgi:hypothetical protein